MAAIALLGAIALFAASAAAAPRPTAVVTYYASDDGPPEAGFAEKVADVMFEDGGPPKYAYTVQGYFLTQSFGTVDFTGDVDDVFGPYQVATPKAGCPFNAWNNEAAKLAEEEDGFNQSNYAQVIYLYENEPFAASTCSSAGVGGGSFAWIDGLNGYTIAHELGHVLGAPHAAAYRCRGADGVTPVTYSANCAEVQPPGDEASEYGDPFDPMGVGQRAGPLEMSAWRKLGFGAIPAGDAPTVTANGTYAIAPLEQATGMRLLRIPNGAGDLFDLDFRQPVGPFDGAYEASEPAVNGVAIHVDDPGFGIGVHPSRLLDMVPSTPTFDDAPLGVGGSFTDFRTGVTIETLSVGPGGATVRISGLPEPPPRRCKVPNLKRKKLKAARRAIRRANCRPGKVKRRASRKVPKARVVSQAPRAGKTAKAGTAVKVVVSSGPPRR